MGYVVTFIVMLFLFFVGSCTEYGLNTYSSKDGELIGQAKKTITTNPIICPGVNNLDVSLGVVRNGTGSISSQDVWVTVTNPEDYKRAKEASSSGALVKVTYDQRRLAMCTEYFVASKVEIIQ
jgi:hypothetical protein